MSFKVGDRVKNQYGCEGTIVVISKNTHGDDIFNIWFDDVPHRFFNYSEYELTKVEEPLTSTKDELAKFKSNLADLMYSKPSRLVGDITSGYRYLTDEEIEKHDKILQSYIVPEEAAKSYLNSIYGDNGLKAQEDRYEHERKEKDTDMKFKIGDMVRIVEACSRNKDRYATVVDIDTVKNPYRPIAVLIHGSLNYIKNYAEAHLEKVFTIKMAPLVPRSFAIKNVIFNDPATIVFWQDGTKTVVKCGEGDTYDPEKGLAMAIAKRVYGDKGRYYETFKKWLPEDKKAKTFQEEVVEFYLNLDPDSFFKMFSKDTGETAVKFKTKNKEADDGQSKS